MLLLALALRLHTAATREMEFDEVASVFISARGPLDILTYLRGAIREHPPLYYLLLWLWIALTGTSEFAMRFLSVGAGMLTVALMYRLLRKTSRPFVALLATLLLVLSPFHIHESQNARMYGLLALWAVLSISTFVDLLDEDRPWRWMLFWLFTGLGVFTHYYMVFVLLAQDVFLILSWRRTRHLWIRWWAIHAVLGGALATWAILSPGLGATIASLWQKGIPSSIRWAALASSLNGLYLGATVEPNWLYLSVPLLATGLGIAVALRSNLWLPKQRGGLLLAALVVVPLVSLLLLPERVTGRYLTAVLPACIVALASAPGWLIARRPDLSRAQRILRPVTGIALLAWIIFLDLYSYPLLYEIPNDGLRDRMAYIESHARSEDGLLLHGPWQNLILTYYSPGQVRRHTMPMDGLQIDPDQIDEHLSKLFDIHNRLWVSYSTVPPVDPDWAVPRWLYDHAYRVWSTGDLVLYYPSPSPAPEPVSLDPVRFGEHLQLEQVALANQSTTPENPILLYSQWRALQDVPPVSYTHLRAHET